LKILTWNINSIRIRLKQLSDVIDELNPDIICLQETKVENGKFPLKDIQELGFKYVSINGQPSYNGVAIFTSYKLQDTIIKDFCSKDDSRHIAIKINHSKLDQLLTIHNFYVPAGGDEPDPNINVKFKHKLQFLDEMYNYINSCISSNGYHVFVGDMNVAPHENDVWSHKQLLNVVSHTDIERQKVNNIIKNNNLFDVMRHTRNDGEKVYSWWSYRNRDWRKSNRGRRLDHIWLSPNLKKYYHDHEIFSDARDFEKPSDHVPVLMELKI
jgi:exodeoxyribonuclease-3